MWWGIGGGLAILWLVLMVTLGVMTLRKRSLGLVHHRNLPTVPLGSRCAHAPKNTDRVVRRHAEPHERLNR